MAPRGKKVPVIVSFEALDRVTGPLRELNKRLEATTAPFKRLSNQFNRFRRASGFDQVAKSAGAFGTSIKSLGNEVFSLGLRLGGMGLAGYLAFQSLIRGTLEAGARLGDVSEQTGLSTEALQKWRFAAEQSGSSADALDKSLVKFSQTLGKARSGSGELVTMLGTESDFLKRLTAMDDTNEAFAFFIEQLGSVPNDANRLTLAMAAFGRSGAEMVNLSKKTRSQREEMFKMRAEMGLITDEQARAMGALNDQIGSLETLFGQIKSDIIADFLPNIAAFADGLRAFFTENRGEIRAFLAQFREFLPTAQDVGDGLRAFGSWVRDAIGFVGEINKRISVFKVALVTMAAILLGPVILALQATIAAAVSLGAALLTTPVGWITLAAGAVLLLYQNWDKVVGAVKEAVAWIRKIPLVNAFATVAGQAYDGIKGMSTSRAPSAFGAPSPLARASTPTRDERSKAAPVDINVKFANAPRGLRLETANPDGVEMSTQLGYAFGPMD